MRNRKRNNLKLILVVILLAISLGYAFLQTDLTINGTGKINASSWDIHFEDLVPNPDNVDLSSEDVAATINPSTLTDITYTITLKEPGDFYEFTVAVVNGGSMNAMVGMITNKLGGVPIDVEHPLPNYVGYTITYSDGIEIAPNHLLEAGYSETIKVRLEYKTDIEIEDLPSDVQTLTFNFGLEYVQADSNAIARPVPSFADDSWETIIANVQNGTIPDYYTVGSTKEVELGNSLGTHTLRIANTSTPLECSTTGFSQTACGFVLEFADIITTHRMNLYTSEDSNLDGSMVNGTGNKGGWEYSDMRAYLNSTIYANESIDYLTTGIYSSLPEVLRNAIINTTVVSGHGTVDTTNYTTTDKLYLLSTHEVFEDVDGNPNSGIDKYDTAYNNTRQLDYYQDQGVTTNSGTRDSAIKQSNGTNSNWWLRSAYFDNERDFHSVYNNGGWTSHPVSNTLGVSPAFRIG